MARYVPEHLERWTLPKYYFGAHWDGYYVAGVGQNRDSGCLDRSNFAVMVRELAKIPEPPDWPHDDSPWGIVRENHFAVGWVEWIAVHEDATDHLKLADKMCGHLENYPVLDESDFSEREEEDCRLTWEKCFDREDRVAYLRRHSWTGSFVDLLKAVRGSWDHAGNILHCPSDLAD